MFNFKSTNNVNFISGINKKEESTAKINVYYELEDELYNHKYNLKSLIPMLELAGSQRSLWRNHNATLLNDLLNDGEVHHKEFANSVKLDNVNVIVTSEYCLVQLVCDDFTITVKHDEINFEYIGGLNYDGSDLRVFVDAKDEAYISNVYVQNLKTYAPVCVSILPLIHYYLTEGNCPYIPTSVITEAPEWVEIMENFSK